ncbi:MAG: methyltransferase [Puia sp.]|nr:methyltransferase [Puia sp.]
MSNSYFQFRQFIIRQDQCAMKVCTDACILGAWFSEKISSYSRILDIGSGTGLLSLMLAQKSKGEIHGIELDLNAFKQMKENIAESNWKERVRAFPGDVRSFAFPGKYDFIITNPPFFEGDLNAGTKEKNLARHSTELTLSALLEVIDGNLGSAGSFGILLPYHRTQYFEGLATGRRFHIREKLLVKQTPGHDFFRSILYFSRNREHFVPVTEMSIRNGSGEYTDEFRELLADYYLHL